MPRLAVIFAFFLQLLSAPLQALAAGSAIEINPVRILVDREDRIHVSYQRGCQSLFAGFILRTNEKQELFLGVASERPNARCSTLNGLEELIIPKLRGSDFAGISSLNPTTEPVFLKLSPLQNFNQVQDAEGFRFEAVYTSQCGTALGLNLFPKANGLELSIVEGKAHKFETCNRSTKIVRYPHINLSQASLLALTNFSEDRSAPLYTLHRNQTRLSATGDGHRVYFLRRCNEAPIGLVREASEQGLLISMLVARYPGLKCPDGAPKKIWTPWNEVLHDEDAIAFSGETHAEQLLIKRPSSYDLRGDTLSIVTPSSCQKDIGLVSRTTKSGYAVGILHIQTSTPCNSGLKEVTYNFKWTYDATVKRDVKPLQLVGI